MALDSSASRYSRIMELVPDVVYILDVDGKLISLSQSFEKITGWKRSEWIGKSFVGLVHPDDLPQAVKVFQATLNGKTSTAYETRIRSKKGVYLIGSFSSSPDMLNGKIVGQIGIGRDITAQKNDDKLRAHYANLIESSDSAIFSRDLEGKIISWNKASESLFGYQAEEIVGQNISILIPENKKLELEKLNNILRKGKPISSFKTDRMTKAGKVIPIVATMSPIKDKDGRVVGVSLIDNDNTLEKKVEGEEKFLASATELLSSSLDYSRTLKKLAKILVPGLADWCSVHIMDEKGDLSQLTVAHVDPRKVRWALELQKKIGRARNDPNNATYKVARSGKPEFYPLITDEIIDAAVKEPRVNKLVKSLKLRSVIIVPLISGRKILGAISLISTNPERLYDKYDLKMAEELGRRAGDAVNNARLYLAAQNEIQERRIIQAELQSAKERLSVILQNVADGITVFDEKAKVVFVNPAVAKASGYKSISEMLKEPIKWRDLFEVMDENGKKLEVKDLPGREAVYTKSKVEKTLKVLNKRSGEERWAEVKANPILDKDGNVRGSVSITHDITQAKELERKKDDFISIASHELKTPITSIKGYIHLLKLQSAVQNREYLEKIDKQLSKLAELVEELLELSRLRSGKLVYKKDKFSFSTLVKEVVSDMQVLDIQHKIVLHNGVKQQVVADRERLSQVLINLISNAVKYSPDSTKVVVKVEKTDDGIRVGIRDFGIGIGMREKGKIFERFYRVESDAHKTFPGLGIGLFLSKEIIRRHNGKIWFQSKRGKGSTFYFQIPI